MAAQALTATIQPFGRATAGAIWIGPSQAAALEYFCATGPLRVLLGPPSSGKSTLLAQFQHSTQDAVVLGICGPQRNAGGVLATLLAAAQLNPGGLSEIDQRNLLTGFIQQRRLQGERIMLCVDNVSRFSPEAWLEIERLRALRTANQPLIELVVAATEADAASSPLCELLHGATSAVESVLFLAPPTDEEVAAYVAWRLSQCDVRTQFSDDACRLISHFAQGRFNLVNALCQLTLRDHQRQPVATIDTAMVKRAAVSFAALQEKAAKSARRGPKKVGADDSADGSPAETRHDRLIVSENRTVVKQVALTGRLVIGRSQDSDLCLPSKFVSRFHAAILPAADGHYFVVNLNSRNGVLVNRTFVSQSALHHGDLLDIGPFRIKVELNEATTAELDAELDDTDRMPAPTFALTPISAVKR